jgi:NADH-quinone oxidoreductase subunit I
LCAVACPANAITVIGAENDPANPTSPGERYGYRYEIDMLRCIFCGWCEEACPTDAIVLTPRFDIADYTRERLIFGKDKLLVKDPFVQHLANTESAVQTDPGVTPDPAQSARPAGGAA